MSRAAQDEGTHGARRDVREFVRRTCAASCVPERLQDPGTVARVVDLLRLPESEQEPRAERSSAP